MVSFTDANVNVPEQDAPDECEARMRMNSWQRCGAAFCSALIACAGSSPAGVGYLPRMGPTQLRFHSAFEADPSKALPPLEIPDRNVSTNAPVQFPTFADEPTMEPQAAYEPPSQIDVQLPAMPLPPPQVGYATNSAPTVQGVLVPQMLLQYFGHATNQPAVMAPPVEFYPPPPPSRSSAVYISR
jgi:hypothetical protein